MKRPTENDEEVINLALDRLMVQVDHWSGGETENDGGARADIRRHLSDVSDGYAFARALEHDGWDGIDTGLVEVLDGAWWYVSAACDEITKKWIVAYGITPKRFVGDEVTFDGNAGAIESIDRKRGTYTVTVPALGHVKSGLGVHGTVVPWEEIDGELNMTGLTVAGPLFEHRV